MDTVKNRSRISTGLMEKIRRVNSVLYNVKDETETPSPTPSPPTRGLVACRMRSFEGDIPPGLVADAIMTAQDLSLIHI